MSPFKNLTGKIYGRLIAISATNKRVDAKVVWLCKCSCGKECEVVGKQLSEGATRSCGCLRKESKKLYAFEHGKRFGEISGTYWTHTKNSAKKRKIEFNLSLKEAWELFENQNRKCALTGQELIFRPSDAERKKQTASLDRIDSSKGYILDNVQWIHKDVNLAKHKKSNKDFINLCKLVSEFNSEKKDD